MINEKMEEQIEDEISRAQTIYFNCGRCPAMFIMGAEWIDTSIVAKIASCLLSFSYPIFIAAVFTSRYFAKWQIQMGNYKIARRINIFPIFFIIGPILLYIYLGLLPEGE